MTHQEVLAYIGQVRAGEIADILDAAMARYRQLYPEWEIIYWATEKTMHRLHCGWRIS